MYADRLNNQCEVAVKEAQTGDRVMQGQVLIAPGDRQMRLVKVGDGYPVSYSHLTPPAEGEVRGAVGGG